MKFQREKHKVNWTAGVAFMAAMMLATAPAAAAKKEEPAEETYDGLVRVADSKVAAAYMDPNADLSGYTKIMILDCHVAFKKNWEKNTTKTGSRHRLSSSDIDRIKSDVAALFRDVFTETLSADDGYEIVNDAGDDVLLIRPAIIDLDIAAPDDMSSGRNRTYTTSSGAATIFIELYDSMTGDILARAADRKTARNSTGYLTYTNRVTNRADGLRMLRKWAEQLREKLDELHGE